MAITDGIYAIAMTILVLEIAVPTIANINSGVVLDGYILKSLLPSVIIYFISFYLAYNFWETNVLLFNFNKITHNIFILNMFILATSCLIPFATGFLFNFYYYSEANIIFALLIMIIGLLYIIMFILLIRDNFGEYFKRKKEIKSHIRKTYNSYEDGIELDNLKLYIKGTTLTIFYILLSPVIIAGISLILAFFSPILSIGSFMFVLVLRFIITVRREHKDDIGNIELSDEEREFIAKVKSNIYG